MKSVVPSRLGVVSQSMIVGLALAYSTCSAAVAEVPVAKRLLDFNPPPQPANVVFSEFQSTAPECPKPSPASQQNNPVSTLKPSDPKLLDPNLFPQALVPIQAEGLTYTEMFPVYFLLPKPLQPERSAAANSAPENSASAPANSAPKKSVASSPDLFVELTLRDRTQVTTRKIPVTTAKQTGYSKLDFSKPESPKPESPEPESPKLESPKREPAKDELKLEADRLYQWSLTGMCPDQKQTYTLTGWIKRVTLPAELAQALTVSSPEEKLKIYRQYGLWYDAVAEAIALAEAGNPEPLRSLLAQSNLNSSTHSSAQSPVP